MEGVPSVPRSVSGVSKLAVEAIVAALTTPGLLGDTRARLCFHLKHKYVSSCRSRRSRVKFRSKALIPSRSISARPRRTQLCRWCDPVHHAPLCAGV